MEAVLAARPRAGAKSPAPTAALSTGKPGTFTAAASLAKCISKPMLSLVSDVRNFQGVEGQFAPLAGPDSLTFGGSLLGLANSHGVNVPDLNEVPQDGVFEATDATGHTWFIRRLGDWFISAFREYTAEELEKRKESWEESLLSGIPKIRVMTCRHIALKLMSLAESMAPDQCPPRSVRRLLKRQIAGMAQLQFDLLYGKSVPMSEIRTRMADLGFQCPY